MRSCSHTVCPIASAGFTQPFGCRGGEDALEWRGLFKQCIELNMWSCLRKRRLHLLCSDPSSASPSTPASTTSSTVPSAAEATAEVGNTLTRILVLIGRGSDAARAAKNTLRACHMLGVSKSELAAQVVLGRGD